MSIAVDDRQQQQFGAGAFAPTDLPQMRFYSSTPQFTNPWQQSQQQPASNLASGHAGTTHNHARQLSQHAAPNVSMALQQQVPAMALPSGFASNQSQAAPMGRFSTDMNMFDQLPMKPMEEGVYPQIRSNSFASLASRKASHPLQNASEAERSSFLDALDASRGMMAMSQDITPRNIYDVNRANRASIDSYGFPATHSHSSSFSSASGYPMYYGSSSVSEASYGDYSSATESVSGRSSYSGSYMGGGMSGGPAAMMSHFSSKVNSLSQKKHKCKICDKRFTRPSSLQTHMYSHTGEKPFACEVEGCGRQFSVVSNLRRHRKVHRGDGETGTESSNYSDADD